ncbi:sensor histidine kinase (plasmid) [Priestia aryabhattai]|uniref:sensor histidine kinase n=1 Tax=Priestia TaxID=2800373 RepID=UPI001780F2A5|nr:ATP-binding protein [Priestia megaterium]MBD8114228.1 histidine kinase [Priestia megaterium]
MNKHNLLICLPLGTLYIIIFMANGYYLYLSDFRRFVDSATLNSFYVTSVISLIFFSIGLFSFFKKQKSIVIKNFFLLTSVSGIAISTSVLSSQDIPVFKTIEIISVFMLSYLLLSFFAHFPVSTKPNYVKIIIFSSLLFSTLSSVVYLICNYLGYVEHSKFFYIYRVLLIGNLFFSIVGCIFLISLHLKTNSLKVRNQLYILIFGILFSFGPLFLFNLIPGMIFGESQIPFVYCLPSIIVFPLTTSYLLVKHEIIEVELEISKWINILIYYILNFLLFSILIKQFMHLSNRELFVICSVGLLSAWASIFLYKIGINTFIQKKTKNRENTDLNEIELFQTLSKEKHAKNLAKIIGKVIHQKFDINGLCIVWNSNNIYHSLHETGIFQTMNQFNFLNEINKLEKDILLVEDQTPSIHMHFEKYHLICFPIAINQLVQGVIVIGEKNNHTLFQGKEFIELKELICESADILSSAAILNINDKQIRRTKTRVQNWNQFNHQVIQSLEKERKRLSIFLHDEILQSLILQLNEVRIMQTKRNFSVTLLDEMDDQLEGMIYNIRKMCHDLHPIIVEDLGLEPSLQSLKREFELNYSILIHVQFNCEFKIISKNHEIQVYRIIKELLNNAVKHSKGKNIKVLILEENGFYQCSVKDDGIGFDVPDNFFDFSKGNHLGLLTIHRQIAELNGSMRISSDKGQGTFVTFTIPLDWEDKNEYTYATSG